MLQSNGYPINFIRQATRPLRGTTTTSNELENAPLTIRRSLLYIQGIFGSVARRLNPNNVKIAQKPHSALRSNVVHVKDPIPTLQSTKSHARFATRLTLGQTGRLLGARLKEHRGSFRRHDTNSCLALHCMNTGHTFNWEDTPILGSANSQRAREAIEALHSGEHSVSQFMQLDPCYRSVRWQNWSTCTPPPFPPPLLFLPH